MSAASYSTHPMLRDQPHWGRLKIGQTIALTQFPSHIKIYAVVIRKAAADGYYPSLQIMVSVLHAEFIESSPTPSLDLVAKGKRAIYSSTVAWIERSMKKGGAWFHGRDRWELEVIS